MNEVDGVVNNGDGTLELLFPGEHRLIVYDSEANFESYVINAASTVIVV